MGSDDAGMEAMRSVGHARYHTVSQCALLID